MFQSGSLHEEEISYPASQDLQILGHEDPPSESTHLKEPMAFVKDQYLTLRQLSAVTVSLLDRWTQCKVQIHKFVKMKHSGFGGYLLKIDVYPTGRARFVQGEPIAES